MAKRRVLYVGRAVAVIPKSLIARPPEHQVKPFEGVHKYASLRVK